MGSVRSRRANKSNVKKATRRVKDKHRKVNIACNPIIEANWDYSLTLAQNYKNLGLSVKLGKRAGGVEADLSKVIKRHAPEAANEEEDVVDENELDENGEFDASKIPEGEARIQRDLDGEVIKVVYGTKKVNDVDGTVEKFEPEFKTEVVKQLEAYANRPIIREERFSSEREDQWLEDLYKKHGEDYKKMFFDKKLNIHQQTEGDLRRRISKWKKKNNIA